MCVVWNIWVRVCNVGPLRRNGVSMEGWGAHVSVRSFDTGAGGGVSAV